MDPNSVSLRSLYFIYFIRNVYVQMVFSLDLVHAETLSEKLDQTRSVKTTAIFLKGNYPSSGWLI